MGTPTRKLSEELARIHPKYHSNPYLEDERMEKPAHKLSEELDRIHQQYHGNPELRYRYAYEWYVKTQDAIWFHLVMDAFHEAEARHRRALHGVTILAITGIILAGSSLALCFSLIFGLL